MRARGVVWTDMGMVRQPREGGASGGFCGGPGFGNGGDGWIVNLVDIGNGM